MEDGVAVVQHEPGVGAGLIEVHAQVPGRGAGPVPCLLRISRAAGGATAMPGPASSPAIRRYPQRSLPAAMPSTSQTMRRRAGSHPGLLDPDLAAQRRRTTSRSQRRIVPGAMNQCSAPWRERGMSVSSTANSARPAQASPGRAAACRRRTASWWRSRRTPASFHAGGRPDSPSHADTWTTRTNTKRKHTRRDHRRTAALPQAGSP
jgi:hypothetical protein